MPPKDFEILKIGLISIVDKDTGEVLVTTNGLNSCTTFELDELENESAIKFDFDKEITFTATCELIRSRYKHYKIMGIYKYFDLFTKIYLFIEHIFFKLRKKSK